LIDRWRTHFRLDDSEGMNVPDFSIFATLIVATARCTEVGSVEEIQTEIVRTHVTSLAFINEDMRNQETASSNHEQVPNANTEPAK
jgi:sporulation protein YlmC with PRC-barrel domain